MASKSPSPKSTPAAAQPPSTAKPSPPSNPSTNSPPPTTSPPPVSPPAAATPPQSSSPPLSLPASPPPSPPLSPPPSPPVAPPPSPPATPPPVVSSPPPSVVQSPPPPSVAAPPPQTAQSPPAATPPTSQSPPPEAAVSPSPPPPANIPTPPSSSSPPPPKTKSPSPPSSTSNSPPPSTSTTPGSAAPSPRPSVPSSSTHPASSPSSTSSNSSVAGSPSSSRLPSVPTEKPTAKTASGNNLSSNSTSTGSGGVKIGGVVAIALVVGLIVISLLVIAVWSVQKRRRRGARLQNGYMASPFASSQQSESLFLRSNSPIAPMRSTSTSSFMYAPSDQGMNNSKSWFTFKELANATNGFSAHNLLGEGGFGCVYKGILTDGREVAVKQLKIGSGQGEREFRAEVEIISRVHHRHLVSLVGYCISEHHRLLVYEYVPNNTLHFHLHGEGRTVLEWSTRVKIAAGAARGIAYLHEDCHPRIIHRDIKSSNILLNSNFEARVSDFGLAKLALDTNTHITTRVMGTFGYMAPEYATSGKLTEKSDVYSFGVVLLEIITGRKPVDASQPLGDESLVEWARPFLAQALEDENFDGLVDPKLEKSYIESEMFRMIEAAAACVRHSAANRPRMSQVVRALDSLDELSDLNNGIKPGQSEVYDSRVQSAQIRMFRRMAFGSQDYSTDFFDRTQSSWRSQGSADQSM